MDERPHVVIVGGGFGGLNAAKELEFTNVRVTIIDRHNHHLFQPLLYQVATAALSAPDIASPIRKVLRDQDNTTVLMDEVLDFDLVGQRVITSAAEIEYDHLIVAAGMRTHYFGNDDWEERAGGLKTLDDALEIRRKVLLAYESAERESDPEVQQEWLTFVVIGAGPTGVELAGALQEIAQRTLAKNFRNFDTDQARVFLLEGQGEVLPNFPSPTLRKKALAQLRQLGVTVSLDTFVDEITDASVVTADGDEIRTRTVVWAAGVKAESLADRLDAEQDKAGRVKVGPDLTIDGYDNVYVIGDMAACTDADGVDVPGLAPAAIQMGQHAATNIKRRIADRGLLEYTYMDKGQMATIGRSKAIAKSGPFEMSGFFAWLAWLFIHLMYLVEFRNRVAVLFEWAYAYLTFQRSARIVIETPRRLPPPVRSFPDDEPPHDEPPDEQPTPEEPGLAETSVAE